MQKGKYGNIKRSISGHEFDSRLEGRRWLVLREAEHDGRISCLRTQVKYELVPHQTEKVEIQLKTKVKVTERVVEKSVCYVADFVYMKDGNEVIEDTKSPATRTPEYIIKRKLMRMQGHPIREITKANEEI